MPADLHTLLADRWKLLRRLLDRDRDGGGALRRVWMIRLEGLRDSIGNGRKGIKNSIHGMVSRRLDQLLDGKGFALRYDGTGYLVVFNAEAPEDFKEAAAKIMRDIVDAVFKESGVCGPLELWAATGIEKAGLRFCKITPPAIIKEEKSRFPVDAALPARKLQKPEDPLQGFDFLYTPVWEAKQSLIFSYLCEPVWKDNPRQPLKEEQLRLRLGSPHHRFALDSQAIHATNEKIQKVAERDFIIRFIVPVHYETLAGDESAVRYIETAQNILKYWFGCVIFEIKSIPASPDRMPRILERILSHSQLPFIRTAPSFRNMKELAELGVHSVGFDLRGDDRSEEDIIKDIEDFAICASKAGVKTHVYGLKTISLSIAAVTAGIDFIGSDAISTSLEGMGMDSFLIKPQDLFITYLKGMSGAANE